jgi:hypothetical protein
MSKAKRRIGSDKIDKIRISTVFLGLNHNSGRGRPLLFETMISGGKHDGFQRRCSTKKQALKGHLEAVVLVREERKQQYDTKLEKKNTKSKTDRES